jgi:hypothetical protein
MKWLLLLIIPFNVLASEPEIIADKAKGLLSVRMDEKLFSTPALFGKVKANTLDISNYNNPVKFDGITPSGIFKIKKKFSWRLNSDMLIFIEGSNSVAAIHPVWSKNKDQKRIERLKSETPDDNYITGGCINVSESFFYGVLNKLPEGTKLTILPN